MLVASLALGAWTGLWPVAAEAQPLGTFRWRTEPYCNVITVTVTQVNAVYVLDGFDEQCGGNPRQPVRGVAVPQVTGSVTLGLYVVMQPGGALVTIDAGISPTSLSGNWRDSAGNSGAFTFNPTSGGGGPRTGPIEPAPIPSAFVLQPQGGFAAVGDANSPNAIPASGPGRRMMWHPAKAAFRAGLVQNAEWDEASTGFYSTAFGLNTIAAGTASFAAGNDVQATANLSVVLGSRATADDTGSFMFGDGSLGAGRMFSFAPNSFSVRAAGGYILYSNATYTAGVQLPAGASAWSVLSDEASKENFKDLAGERVLAKIARMPVREWNYKAQDASIRHVGPTAQDFHAAFGLGEDPKRISTIDADGIALAAVKALEARTQSLAEENRLLRERIEALERRDR
jgi:hypothetical protein